MIAIEGVQLDASNLRETVIYVPRHAKGDNAHKDCEAGVITSIREPYVFVCYDGEVLSKATRPQDLRWAVAR